MEISAVIATSGPEETDKLSDCLRSIREFAKEVVIFNLGREDLGLKKLTKKYNAQIIDCEPVSYIELIRNKMVNSASGEWVLVLDPDERLTLELVEKLKELTEGGKYTAVSIPRRNVFFGQWIRHTNWWPDRHVRFFKKGKVSWSRNIHEYPKVLGRQMDLAAREELAIVHLGYDNLNQFLDRQNRYSDIEADNLRKLGEKPSLWKLFWWPTREFLQRYVKHSGFLDGFWGFALSLLMAIYKMTVWVKLWELQNKGKVLI